jgi:5'-nucleotidase
MLLNVNIPAVHTDQIAGVKVTRQGIRRYFDMFEKRLDPRGKTYYWLAGEVLEEVDESESDVLSPFGTTASRVDLEWSSSMMTDVQAIRQNYITVTPLQYNLTSISGLTKLQDWQPIFFK